MYVDNCTYRREGKTYTRILLRESRRVGGKVVKRTVGNITQWPPEVRDAIISALPPRRRGAAPAERPGGLADALARHPGCGPLMQGKSAGAVATVLAVASRLGLPAALGDDRQGRLALYQVLARVMDQGSRLSAVRQARTHLGAELLGLGPFDEDDLYANLDWLAGRQALIEDRLFAAHCGPSRPSLFLYDVTSSYFEGTENELAAFGYNRDGKRGKKQVVAGLLTAADGMPVSIELFCGNTADPGTVPSQIAKLRDRFGGGELTLVGDRGMVKSPQRKELGSNGMHYLTAITKIQIECLLRRGRIQMELFDEQVAEVIDPEAGVRYLLRRNPEQADRMAARREDQFAAWREALAKANKYLAGHPRAKVETALRHLRAKAATLKLSAWLAPRQDGRRIELAVDEETRAEAGGLDGCYVLVTDLPVSAADPLALDRRYHDLAKVEWAFRTCKTAHLEIRPIHVRTEAHTRGHALVVMLAYVVVRELRERWVAFDLTVEDALKELAELCAIELRLPDGCMLRELPQPRESTARLLDAAGVELPRLIPPSTYGVDTKTKLTNRRKGLK